MKKTLQSALVDVFKILKNSQKEIIYSALLKSDKHSMDNKKQKQEIALKELKKIYTERIKAYSKKKKENRTEKEQEILDQKFIIIERELIRTYFKHNIFILDINQKIEIMRGGNIVIEYTYMYEEEDELYQQIDTIVTLLQQNHDEIKKDKLSYDEDFYPCKRFEKPFFLIKRKKSKKQLADPKGDVIISKGEYKKSIEGKGTRIVDCIKIHITLGSFKKGQKVEFLTSLSLPTSTLKKEKPEDFLSFRYNAAYTKATIQEEVYGSSHAQLEAELLKEDPDSVGEWILADIDPDTDRNLYYNKYTWEAFYSPLDQVIYRLAVSKE